MPAHEHTVKGCQMLTVMTEPLCLANMFIVQSVDPFHKAWSSLHIKQHGLGVMGMTASRGITHQLIFKWSPADLVFVTSLQHTETTPPTAH